MKWARSLLVVCVAIVGAVVPTAAQESHRAILEISPFFGLSMSSDLDSWSGVRTAGVRVNIPVTSSVSVWGERMSFDLAVGCVVDFGCTNPDGKAYLAGIELTPFAGRERNVRTYFGAGLGKRSSEQETKLARSVYGGIGLRLNPYVVPRLEIRWERWPYQGEALMFTPNIQLRIPRPF